MSCNERPLITICRKRSEKAHLHIFNVFEVNFRQSYLRDKPIQQGGVEWACRNPPRPIETRREGRWWARSEADPAHATSLGRQHAGFYSDSNLVCVQQAVA